MPLYEFCCSKCGNKFELFRPYSKSGEGAPCPKCKSSAKRAMSTFIAFNFDSVGYRNFVTGAGNFSSTPGSVRRPRKKEPLH